MRIMVALIVLSSVTFAAPKEAAAHAHLAQASPKPGSTVSPAPKKIVLSFTEKLEPKFSSVEVRDAQGASVQAGKAQSGANRAQLQVQLKPLGPGTYTVNWRVLSVDTHRTKGTFTFKVGR
ncbi:MAG TPA: copper homeostasis periplasmic binding protein CopC [Pseudolabrys sp.]|nr:copper homeostasis periplasmic binding protein CopC [Pseudolabrys sp.]